ncbi:hypothetical protein IV203_021282 [Nitzschia inconspicua]|uniref:Uncharacterized protein n=1 Tax=Nitzschia inconspicua TaxID=303405 RepID=A0A9K3KGM5_9STRA|nr:hypothetical protein IV203_021282 [Nitzschia inconspicua]
MAEDFSWHWPPSPDNPPNVQWDIERSSYEIYVHKLKSFRSTEVVPHCVQVMTLIRREVDNEKHLGESYFRVLPKTLSTQLEVLWTTVVQGMGENLVMSVDNFNIALKRFIATNRSPLERHYLVQKLRNPKKPRDLSVLYFYHRLIELNGYVEYLPGTDPPLNPDQLKHAFYDGMPALWRERYVIAGLNCWDKPIAEILRYFRNQEALSARRFKENQDSRRIKNKRKSKGEPHRSDQSQSIKDKKSNGNKKQKGRISDEDPCPVHPGSKHTWGQCNANRFNKQRTKKETKE